jgi:hypothetical protein
MPSILDSDKPADDGNACTDEICASGLPSHPPEPARTPCTQSQGVMCNGSASMPACVVCVAATDCPGTDTICHKRVCGNQNTCGFSNASAGTAAEPDATGNCQKAVCDDLGGVTSVADNSDVPADDGNACTDDVCSNGAPAHPAKPQGTTCAQNGGTFCSGTTCVQCVVAGDCPGSDTACRTRTCDSAGHTCGHTDQPQGTAAGSDAAGNCKKQVCDGAGAIVPANDDTDLPVDGNPCTKDVCSNGTASNPNLPAGTICSTSPDNSKACDANAACNTLTFRVVHLGPGTSNASTAVAIDEWTSAATMVGSVPLPTTAGGGNQPLTMSGSASSEGCLSLSGDGHSLALAGYASMTGVGSIKGTTVNRVAGLVDLAGTINTSLTFATGDNGDNVRSATTLDGVDVWISGAGSSSNGGVWYNRLVNPLATEAHVVQSPLNTRCLGIFGGQLYVSASSGAFNGVFTVGFGTPTTAGQALGALPGLTVTSGYGFAMFDLPGGPSGLDTIYVADDAAGLQKWTYDGSNWSLATTLNITNNAGFRGVAGYAAGATVTLMASTAENSPNRLVVFVDTGSGTPSATAMATAASNTTFRGVAVSPHFPAP